MKKCLWTLNIGNYEPAITHFTYPWLKRYAAKIGAEFREITERKFHDYPVTYEKLQIHELGRAYDWNIYCDADALIHPDFIDITDQIPKSTVLHNGQDMAPNRFAYDEYFRRDGRNIGSCNWFTVASNWCLDLWQPPGISLSEIEERIFLTTNERIVNMERLHLIDDFVLSRNIARFGLHFDTIPNVLAKMGHPNEHYLFHQYAIDLKGKIEGIIKQLMAWGLAKEAGLPMIAKSDPAAVAALVDPAEGAWLAENAKTRQSIVEIGSYHGGSSIILAANCPGTVYCVDVWDVAKGRVEDPRFDSSSSKYAIFEANLKQYIDSGKVVPRRMSSTEASQSFCGPQPDMIFIDGSHDYESVKADIQAWQPLLANGGLLCGHDFSDEFPGVKQAVTELLPDFKLVPGTRIWYV